MANVFSFPLALHGTRLVSNSPLLNPRASNSHKPLIYENNVRKSSSIANSGLQFLHQNSIKNSFPSRHRGLLLVPFNNAKSSEPMKEDSPALEAVLNLHNAIKNQNIDEVSNIIGDECRCVCNFFSFFELFQGKQQVLDFFKHVIKILGSNIEFVVRPTMHNGMNVGVSWRLKWSKTHMPLGKGFSFYICQNYHGKVVIRNVEMFIEPILHIEPIRLKILAYAMSTAEMMSSLCKLSPDYIKKVITTVLLIAIILHFMKPGLY